MAVFRSRSSSAHDGQGLRARRGLCRERGHVVAQTARALHALVEGSDIEPYRVAVQFDESGIVEAGCSCPYGEELDGWCKHIVAVLIAYQNEDYVEEQMPVVELLNGLSREELAELVESLAQGDPDAYEEVAAWVWERHGS